MSTDWIEGGPVSFGADEPAEPVVVSQHFDESKKCFVFRNADGTEKELPLRDVQAAGPLAYPQDNGLKTQVRPYSETCSIDDVLLAERIRQQQDLAHDQGAFDGRTLEDCKARFEPVTNFGGVGSLRIGDKDYPVSHVSVSHDNPITLPPPPQLSDTRFGRIEVTGEITVHFRDDKLLDLFLYGPRWKRELSWAIHNVIAHPLSEITHWLGYLHPKIRDWGLWFHDRTVPLHAPNTGRG